MITSVAALIESHEGRRAVPYPDTRGRLTCGVGHCLDTNIIWPGVRARFAALGIDPRVGPWPDELIDAVRDDDISEAVDEAAMDIGAEAWNGLNAQRQAALTDMAFEMGEDGLKKFEHLIAAVQLGQWENAAAEALASAWAAEVPARAKTDAAMLRTGEWPNG